MKGRLFRGLERFFLFQNSAKMAGSRSSKFVGESSGGFTDLPLKTRKDGGSIYFAEDCLVPVRSH